MIRQIKKQGRVFAAIVVLFVVSMGIAGYILSNQRFFLPAWFPLVGTDFYEVETELSTAQAVVPGQGQTVNIAGVKVGEVGEVKLEDGHAVVTMRIRDEYKPIYKDATILLRPKTGLKDMILALDPGTESAGEVEEGGRIQVANTLPDVNPDEVLASLDGDTRAYLRILLNAGGTAFRDEDLEAGQQTACAGPARDLQALRAHGARRREVHAGPDQAAPEHPPRDPQLPGAVHGARREGQAAGPLRGLVQRELRGVRPGGGKPA